MSSKRESEEHITSISTQASKISKTSGEQDIQQLVEGGNGDINGSHVTPEENDKDFKWQLDLSNVKDRIGFLRRNSHFSDCLFLIGQGENLEPINTHSLVLRMSSPYFDEMLSNGEKGPITIENEDPKIFNFILDYLYNDKTDVTVFEDAIMVYKSALKYQLPHLCEKMAKHIAQDLNIENVWQILEMIAESNENSLLVESRKFIQKKTTEIIHHQNFKELSHRSLQVIVNLEFCDVTELEVIQSVTDWAKHQCRRKNEEINIENLRECVGKEVISKLHFLTTSAKDFVKNVAFMPDREGILTMEESYAILMNMTVGQCFPLPDVISSNSSNRKLFKKRCIRQLAARPTMSPFQQATSISAPSIYPDNSDQIFAFSVPMQNYNFGGKIFCSEISVDIPVTIFGITVPGLWYIIGKTIGPSYDESFVVTITDSGNTVVGRTSLNTKVEFGKKIDIMMESPVILLKQKTYKFQVYTSNCYFLCKRMIKVENCPPVVFTFKDIAKVSTNSGLNANQAFGNKSFDVEYAYILELIYSL